MEDCKKQILANDLCGRLKHNVMVRVGTTYDIANDITEDGILEGIKFNDPYFGTKALVNVKTNSGSVTFGVAVEDVKPYLRPMSSMTEKELNECVYQSGIKDIECPNWQDIPKEKQFEARLNHAIAVFLTECNDIDWLNAHHFDHRGLIPMGLALEALEEMYG